jgi:cell division protein FtsW
VTGLLPSTGVPLPFISAGGTSLLVSFLVLGMLISFARHEAPAVQAARRAARLGHRTRLERWLHVPVPRAYVPPRRRPAAVARERAARTAGGRPPATKAGRPAVRATPAATKPSRTLPATGTEGRR